MFYEIAIYWDVEVILDLRSKVLSADHALLLHYISIISFVTWYGIRYFVKILKEGHVY